jgi:hypothetical protein
MKIMFEPWWRDLNRKKCLILFLSCMGGGVWRDKTIISSTARNRNVLIFLVRNLHLRWSFFSDEMNVREYRRSKLKWTVQRNCQIRTHKMTKSHKKKRKNKAHYNTIFVGCHYAQTKTNNINKTWSTAGLILLMVGDIFVEEREVKCVIALAWGDRDCYSRKNSKITKG